jgi:hypothetical protein
MRHYLLIRGGSGLIVAGLGQARAFAGLKNYLHEEVGLKWGLGFLKKMKKSCSGLSPTQL